MMIGGYAQQAVTKQWPPLQIERLPGILQGDLLGRALRVGIGLEVERRERKLQSLGDALDRSPIDRRKGGP